MFCLVTDLMDWEEYPAPELAALYKWRWDGSETALREAKAPLRGAGPGTGADAPLRLPGPGRAGARGLGRRHRDDPRRHPRRRPRRRARAEGTPRRAPRPAPRPVPRPRPPRGPVRDPPRERLLPGRDQRDRGDTGTSSTGTGTAPASPSPPRPSRTPARRTPSPASPPPSSPWPTPRPDQRKHRKPARTENPAGPWTRPPRRDTPPSGMPAGRELPAVTKNRNYPQPVKHLKPMALRPPGHPHDFRVATAGLREVACRQFLPSSAYHGACRCPPHHWEREFCAPTALVLAICQRQADPPWLAPFQWQRERGLSRWINCNTAG